MSSKYPWMSYLARFLTMTSVAVSIVGIILYSVDLYRHGQQHHYIGWFSSAGFVLLTIPISIRLIVTHLTHWNSPNIQKYVVRIIWMVPIYAIESWLALRFKSLSLYIETLRECYEAYAIFSFLYFLIALLGDEQQIIAKLKEKSMEYGHHKWPISLIVSPWAMGSEMLNKCKMGVLQYVIIKNLAAIMVCILQSNGVYHEGRFRFNEGYLYQCVICNISQLWALYCLILFYFATKEELTPWRPVGKFLCVKMVVFATWWQSILISAFASMGIIDDKEDTWTVTEIAQGLQDYLICIEMFFASIAFTYAFTHKDYITQRRKTETNEPESQRPFFSALLQSSLPDDILSDIRHFAPSLGLGITRKSSNEMSSKDALSELDDGEPNELNALIDREKGSSDDLINDVDYDGIEIVTVPSGEDSDSTDAVAAEKKGSVGKGGGVTPQGVKDGEEKLPTKKEAGGDNVGESITTGSSGSSGGASQPHATPRNKLSSNSFYNTNNTSSSSGNPATTAAVASAYAGVNRNLELEMK